MRKPAVPYALLVIVLAALGGPATAHCAERMYQWTDPSTGRTHFSGRPPHWYRKGDGPRVLVFEDGRLVDDTAHPAVDVPGTIDDSEASDDAIADAQPAGEQNAGAPAITEDDAARVARLKALIAAWEALRTAEARAALGEDARPPGADAPDAAASPPAAPAGEAADRAAPAAPGHAAR